MQHASDTYLLSGYVLATTGSMSRFIATYNRTLMYGDIPESANDRFGINTPHVLTFDICAKPVSLN
jgi:hypothetical protein